MRRKFVESRGFSADRARLEKAGELALEDLVVLEQSILVDPMTGDVVPGTGGLRKVRVGQRSVGRGKRGGARVYYLDIPKRETTHLLAIFGKRERADLSAAERKGLARYARVLKEPS